MRARIDRYLLNVAGPRRTPALNRHLAYLLALVAGVLNSVGFVAVAVYTSHMTGLTAMVAVQAFVNLSVVLGMMPTKGIPLPFVSAGGSSLLINLVGMGILLNVSQHASGMHEA